MNTTTERVRLIGWGTFEELSSPIRALLFGQMVRRAIPVMHEYHSDLYHDARWIEANVNGPTSFDWLVRPSGTNLGEAAKIGVKIGAGEGAQFYRVEVKPDPARSTERAADWIAEFTNVPLAQVNEPEPSPFTVWGAVTYDAATDTLTSGWGER